MTNDYSFHVRNAQPGDMLAVLTVLHSFPNLGSVNEIVEQAEQIGFEIRDRLRLEALTTARDLGLVERTANRLTQAGHAVFEIESNKPALFPDIIHGLQYSLWSSENQWVNCFSWTYRSTCQTLWQTGKAILDRRGLASEIEATARSRFGRDDISLSPKSVGGVLLWLKNLRPSVLQDENEFAVRQFCPPELFLMAVDHVYKTDDLEYGANLLLNDPRQEAICQMCLMDVLGFERVLQYALTQSALLEKGIGGGWGYYLRLEREVRLEDIL
jgi:hypothetical protein